MALLLDGVLGYQKRSFLMKDSNTRHEQQVSKTSQKTSKKNHLKTAFRIGLVILRFIYFVWRVLNLGFLDGGDS